MNTNAGSRIKNPHAKQQISLVTSEMQRLIGITAQAKLAATRIALAHLQNSDADRVQSSLFHYLICNTNEAAVNL